MSRNAVLSWCLGVSISIVITNCASKSQSPAPLQDDESQSFTNLPDFIAEAEGFKFQLRQMTATSSLNYRGQTLYDCAIGLEAQITPPSPSTLFSYPIEIEFDVIEDANGNTVPDAAVDIRTAEKTEKASPIRTFASESQRPSANPILRYRLGGIPHTNSLGRVSGFVRTYTPVAVVNYDLPFNEGVEMEVHAGLTVTVQEEDTGIASLKRAKVHYVIRNSPAEYDRDRGPIVLETKLVDADGRLLGNSVTPSAKTNWREDRTIEVVDSLVWTQSSEIEQIRITLISELKKIEIPFDFRSLPLAIDISSNTEHRHSPTVDVDGYRIEVSSIGVRSIVDLAKKEAKKERSSSIESLFRIQRPLTDQLIALPHRFQLRELQGPAGQDLLANAAVDPRFSTDDFKALAFRQGISSNGDSVAIQSHINIDANAPSYFRKLVGEFRVIEAKELETRDLPFEVFSDRTIVESTVLSVKEIKQLGGEVALSLEWTRQRLDERQTNREPPFVVGLELITDDGEVVPLPTPAEFRVAHVGFRAHLNNTRARLPRGSERFTSLRVRMAHAAEYRTVAFTFENVPVRLQLNSRD